MLDGNGSTIAEGGVIGHLKREHAENIKKLSRIQWLAVTILLGLIGNLVALVKFH